MKRLRVLGAIRGVELVVVNVATTAIVLVEVFTLIEWRRISCSLASSIRASILLGQIKRRDQLMVYRVERLGALSITSWVEGTATSGLGAPPA